MALENYILNGPSTVIYVDGRNAATSWQNHLDRTDGLRGGVDLVAVVGTPVYAPTPGRWWWLKNNGGAGNSGEFHHDLNRGWRDVFSHLSRYVGVTGQHFEQGDLIGYTGATGGVVQHLHRHLLDPQNRRQNPWLYFSGTSTAGNSGVPIVITAVPEPKEEAMKIIRVEGGTIALLGEFTSSPSGSASQGNAFSYGLNEKVFGVESVSHDQATTLLREATNRRNGLIADIAATVIAALPKVQGGAGGSVDVAAIAKAVQDEQDRRERERLS